MSIFTNKRDRKEVPLLVQLAQISPEEEDELRYAYYLVLSGEYEGDDTSLEAIAETCEITYETLFGIATQSSIPANCLEWLNENRQSDLKQWQLAHDSPKAENDAIETLGAEPVSLNEIIFEPLPDYFFELDFHAEVAERLHEFVLTALQEMKSKGNVSALISICAECQNPMLLLGQKREYCSHRCVDRAGARKRRLRKKGDDKKPSD